MWIKRVAEAECCFMLRDTEMTAVVESHGLKYIQPETLFEGDESATAYRFCHQDCSP